MIKYYILLINIIIVDILMIWKAAQKT